MTIIDRIRESGGGYALSLEKAEFGAGTLSLVLELSAGGAKSRHAIRCAAVKEYRISDAACRAFGHYAEDHILLDLYRHAKYTLSISGVEDKERLVGVLFQHHVGYLGDWVALDRFIDLQQLFQSKKDFKVKDCPEIVCQIYEKALRKANAAYEKRPAKSKPVQCQMVEFGDNYVVAESVSEECLA